jgi:uncharacterized repeat protein (TIGR03803 family)
MGLTALHGLLYGTTTAGGAKTFGTIFERGLSGKVRTLYSFQGGTDGSEPDGPLVELNGVLYGMTEYGGSAGDGTIFAMRNGKERVLYAFKGGSDGATPVLAGLVALGGKLYGTTNAGGDSKCRVAHSVGCGVVFEVTSTGSERVIYRFRGKPDGAAPSGVLIVSGGVLYGTTEFGGTYDNGSVFWITTGGAEKRLYGFKGYPDGATPFAGLTELNGSFYGTTTLGGAYDGSGTVFELNASGSESVLHSFKGAPDGALPYAGLTVVGDALYGATEVGGSSEPSCIGHGIVGCGTIFSIGSSGNLSLIYRFKGRKDGTNPLSTLVLVKDALYGTTFGGGDRDNGTVFEIVPQK